MDALVRSNELHTIVVGRNKKTAQNELAMIVMNHLLERRMK